jgi:hypothetical protein
MVAPANAKYNYSKTREGGDKKLHWHGLRSAEMQPVARFKGSSQREKTLGVADSSLISASEESQAFVRVPQVGSSRVPILLPATRTLARPA